MMGRWDDAGSVDLANWGIEGSRSYAWIAGCGTVSPLIFGRRNPGTYFRASDLSRRSLRILRTRLFIYGIHNVRPCNENILETSFHEQKFDAIDSYGVLHHLPDPKLGLLKLSESLRTGGVLRLMLYRDEIREPIEGLRSEVLALKHKPSFSELRRLIRVRGLDSYAEFESVAGIADAILNPQVMTFNRAKLNELLSEVPRMKTIRILDHANWIVFLKKTSPE